MMKNIILAGMIVAGIAVVVTANKKPAEIAQPVIGDIKKPMAGKSKVIFEDDLDGDFTSARKVKGTKGKEKVIEQSESDGELVEDDGDDAWDDKEGEEEIEDVDSDEEPAHDHGHGLCDHDHGAKKKNAAAFELADEEEEEDDSDVEEVEDFSDDEEVDGSDSGETVSDEEEVDPERQATRDELEKKLLAFKETIVWEDNKPSLQSFMTLRGLINEHNFSLF
jgi:hypothetical protein